VYPSADFCSVPNVMRALLSLSLEVYTRYAYHLSAGNLKLKFNTIKVSVITAELRGLTQCLTLSQFSQTFLTCKSFKTYTVITETLLHCKKKRPAGNNVDENKLEHYFAALILPDC
jgi:hypothetical protein